jgi:hypothetical protein
MKSAQHSAGAFCVIPENPSVASRRRRRPRRGEKVVHARPANQWRMPAPGHWQVGRGRPAHVPHSSIIAMDQTSGRTPETPDAMTSDQALPVQQSEARAFLAKAASGCGGLLNSLMVMLGDKLGVYKTGQYSAETDDDR